MASQTHDEIIEKRESHPVATACLTFAMIAILASVVLQFLEISEVRAGMNATEKNRNEILQTENALGDLEAQVNSLLSGSKVSDEDKESNKEIKRELGMDDDDDADSGDDDDDDAGDDDDDDDDDEDLFGDDDL